jgi:hypothetical protein
MSVAHKRTCSCSATSTRRPSSWRSRLAGAVECRPATQKNAAAHLAPLRTAATMRPERQTRFVCDCDPRGPRAVRARDRTLNWRH